MRGNASKRQKGVQGRASKWHSIAVLTANRRPVSFLLLALGHACGMRVDGPLARGLWPPDGGRLCSLALRGQRPFGPRVADCRSAAMLIKSALRDWLYESYSLIRITVISHLRWLSPLWCLTAPPSPRGIGRATKGKRLYGQARRLTSPDLHILCRMCTVDNKAPRLKVLSNLRTF